MNNNHQVGVLETYDGYDDYYWIVYHVFCCYKLIGQIDAVLETSWFSHVSC